MVFFARKVAHFVFFYYLCARKIRGVHQLAADVDYFFRAKKHTEIKTKSNRLFRES